ncbi:MAG: hypothetical protein AABW72_02400 [archaeon]
MKPRNRPKIRKRQEAARKSVNPAKRWSELGSLQAKSFQETQLLLAELEARTPAIEVKVNAKTISKKETLDFLDLRKRFLKNSMNGWLIQDEMAGLLSDAAAMQAAKAKALQALSRRRHLLELVEKAEVRITAGEDISTVLTEMQEEYAA